MSPRALILGASGQDGSYLSRFLLGKGYEVVGTSRAIPREGCRNHIRLGISERVRLESISLRDSELVRKLIGEVKPDEIYHLAGQSSVGQSFQQPKETFEDIVLGTLNVLEAVRQYKGGTRFFNAASGECFGQVSELSGAVIETPFRPLSPYAAAKAAAFWNTATYRSSYGLFACSGILFSHESPLRTEHFVTRKIVSGASRIVAGAKEKLRLGRLDIQRDWGWAPDYVEAMWAMLQQPAPRDFVIATGETHSLEEFVARVFSHFGLQWREHVETDPGLFRPTDVSFACGNPEDAKKLLDWSPRVSFDRMIDLLIRGEADLASFSGLKEQKP